MRILYVCSADLSGTVGSMGSVRHIMEVSENLCALGNQVTLIVPGYARYPHATPVRIVYVPLIKVRFLRTLMFELLTPCFMLFRLLAWRPRVVYWRQAYLTIFPVLLSRALGWKIVAEVNGLTLDEIESEPLSPLRKKVILAFERFNYRFANRLICVAPQIRRRILDHYRLSPDKVSVILNAVNAERMPVMDPAEAKREIGIDPDSPVIGFVGHLFPWDGIEFLIEAAPAILAKFPSTRFVIVGHGQWGTHLEGLAREKGLSAAFLFAGKVQWERLYVYVNAFDVATAPYAQAINTQSGRSSLKLLEYFACEKPVVASKTEVIPEVVDLDTKGFGVTVEPENADALAEALLRLLGDVDMRREMGRGGRDYVLRERSWAIVAQRTNEIIRKLVE